MSAEFIINGSMNHRGMSGDPVRISVEAENDQGAFLSIVVTDSETDEEVVAIISANPGEVDYFFRQVDEARARWKEMTGNA
jgi:DNA polymerase IIIc chi subunit